MIANGADRSPPRYLIFLASFLSNRCPARRALFRQIELSSALLF